MDSRDKPRALKKRFIFSLTEMLCFETDLMLHQTTLGYLALHPFFQKFVGPYFNTWLDTDLTIQIRQPHHLCFKMIRNLNQIIFSFVFMIILAF